MLFVSCVHSTPDRLLVLQVSLPKCLYLCLYPPNRLTREPTCDYMGKRGSPNTRKRVELVCMNTVLSERTGKG
jgi:hypothetical protein